MNSTINISLPAQLKLQADQAINDGHFASFSDLVRTGIRKLLNNERYEQMWEQAKTDHVNNNTKVIQTKEDINQYFKEIASNAKNRNDKKIRQRAGKIRKSNSNIQKNSKDIFPNSSQFVSSFT
jgi:Arc/MetJ-type ribon-helix-helix transcriptional regulator